VIGGSSGGGLLRTRRRLSAGGSLVVAVHLGLHRPPRQRKADATLGTVGARDHHRGQPGARPRIKGRAVRTRRRRIGSSAPPGRCELAIGTQQILSVIRTTRSIPARPLIVEYVCAIASLSVLVEHAVIGYDRTSAGEIVKSAERVCAGVCWRASYAVFAVASC
jgi:hypothetical protein